MSPQELAVHDEQSAETTATTIEIVNHHLISSGTNHQLLSGMLWNLVSLAVLACENSGGDPNLPCIPCFAM